MEKEKEAEEEAEPCPAWEVTCRRAPWFLVFSLRCLCPRGVPSDTVGQTHAFDRWRAARVSRFNRPLRSRTMPKAYL